jgi:hypothetical protein
MTQFGPIESGWRYVLRTRPRGPVIDRENPDTGKWQRVESYRPGEEAEAREEFKILTSPLDMNALRREFRRAA